MLVYRESPVDTLLNQIPFLLQLLQSNNASAIRTAIHTRYTLASNNPVSCSSLLSSASLRSSPHAKLLSAATNLSSLGSTTLDSEAIAISPLMSGLVALVTYLEGKGYSDLRAIPGYGNLIALQSFKKRWLDPFLSFIFLHRTLTVVLTALHLWMAAELIFYIVFWKRLTRLQEVDRVIKGVATKAKRRELFQRCLETIDEGDGLRKWVGFWFSVGRSKRPARLEDIGRANMLQWLAWALWAAPYEEAVRSPSAAQELNQMVDTIERVKKVKFIEGYNSDVDCIRPCLDPVIASHRPLLHYSLVWVVKMLMGLLFRRLGFTRYKTTLDQTSACKVPQHAKAIWKGKSHSVPDLAYWYRIPDHPQNETPLVFIHGIGLGFIPYVHLIIALTSISRPLILIEIPYVTSQLFQADCITLDDTYLAIERLLHNHRHTRATFMGHSFGTMLCAAICRASPTTLPKSIIAGMIFIDPICFLTHYSLARNFAYRTPSTACQLLIDLFAAGEISVAWYVMRRFNWTEGIIFPVSWARRHQKSLLYQGKLSPVLPERTRVFLSGKDDLLDMNEVAEYLRKQVGLEEELVIMEGLEHGQLLLHSESFLRVLRAAQEC
ncbi:hypothetical protein BGX28_005696 [Mortierella sp. GBA30]|nr:hypothetical protein BGX28_005696 [Mortierella sp. GBA30]